MRWERAISCKTGFCLLVAIGCCLAVSSGCSSNHAPTPAVKAISPQQAAELAATLANDKCESKYRKRPFKPEQHPAVREANKYRWGGLDVGGPGGLSALVTFREDGSQPHVEIYYSNDRLAPPSYSPPSTKSPRL
jgi:hypothetical protein